MTKEKGNTGLKSWAKFSTIALQMGVTIYLGNKLGVWLDKKYDTNWLEQTVTLFAIFISIYLVIRGVMHFNK